MSDNISEIKKKTKNAVYWDFFSKFSTQGMQFLFSIILARILSPTEYGIIALPMVFLAVAQCFVNSGFSAALIRKSEITEKDLSTAFYFSVLVGIVCYIILYLLSPYIALFYNEPILCDLLKVTALSTILVPLQSVQYALLNRKLDYKTPAIIAFWSNLITGLVGIFLAYDGYGVWALVFQGISGNVFSLIAIWTVFKWRPRFIWSWDSFHYLFGFGSKILASGVIDALHDNIYPIVIGKYYSAKDLGLYNRALGYAKLPFTQINGMLDSISYPVLSRLQGDPNQLSSVFLRFLRINIFILCPVMLGLASLAYPLIIVMITEKWVMCVPFLQILCLPVIFWPIQTLNFTILKVLGRSDILLRLNIGIKILGVIIMCFTVPMGIIAMCYGAIIHAILGLSWAMYYTGRLTKVGLCTQVKEMFPSVLLGVIMFLLIKLSIAFVDSFILQLVVGIVVGSSCYILLAVLFRRPELKDVLYLLKFKE